MLSSIPGTFVGAAAYALALSVAFGETPFWAETSEIGQTLNRIGLWLVLSAAVFVGIVRLYDVRMDALNDRQARQPCARW